MMCPVDAALHRQSSIRRKATWRCHSWCSIPFGTSWARSSSGASGTNRNSYTYMHENIPVKVPGLVNVIYIYLPKAWESQSIHRHRCVPWYIYCILHTYSCICIYTYVRWENAIINVWGLLLVLHGFAKQLRRLKHWNRPCVRLQTLLHVTPRLTLWLNNCA